MLYNKNVEFYVKESPKVECNIEDCFGNNNNQLCPIESKICENIDLEAYGNYFGKFPSWNKQEQGRNFDWEKSITDIRKAIGEKQKIAYIDDHKDNDIYMLYHWKHSDMDFRLIETEFNHKKIVKYS